MGNKVGWQMDTFDANFYDVSAAEQAGVTAVVLPTKLRGKLTDMLRLFKRSVPQSCSRSV